MAYHRVCRWLLSVSYVCLSIVAAYWVGFLLGWMTGVSLSPVVSTVAPLVFGLLAVVGVGVGLRRWPVRQSDIWHGLCVAIMVSVFCYGCFIGVAWGNMSRLDPYKPMDMLIGESWSTTGDQTAARLYALRWKARQAQVPHQEFEGFIVDVIRPILNRKSPDQEKQIQAALDVIEAALPPVSR